MADMAALGACMEVAALTDEFAGTVTDNADAKNPFGARFDDEFRQTIGSVVGQSATTSAPREFGDFD